MIMEKIVFLLAQVIEELQSCSPPVRCRDKITRDFVKAGEQASMIGNLFAELLKYNMGLPDYRYRGSKAKITADFDECVHAKNPEYNISDAKAIARIIAETTVNIGLKMPETAQAYHTIKESLISKTYEQGRKG